MPPYQIEHIRNKVAEAVELYNGRAEEHDRIDRVSLFGSYAEGRASASSDVDLLVSFSSPAVSLISLARALEAMEDSLGGPRGPRAGSPPAGLPPHHREGGAPLRSRMTGPSSRRWSRR